jgi:hypothetical protein
MVSAMTIVSITTTTITAASHWTLPTQIGNGRGVHKFTCGPSGMKYIEIPHININSGPLSVFFFFEVMKLLVVEKTITITNIWSHLTKYHH